MRLLFIIILKRISPFTAHIVYTYYGQIATTRRRDTYHEAGSAAHPLETSLKKKRDQ